MSAVLSSEEVVVADTCAKSGAAEICEGDWNAYSYRVARCRTDKTVADRYGSVMAYKRACALAYFGKRAQLHGDVCNTMHPHTMTQQFIADLEVSNRTIGYARYPWRRTLKNLLSKIDQIQDRISTNNAITLVPATK